MSEIQCPCPHCACLDASMFNMRCAGCMARVKNALIARRSNAKPDAPYLAELADQAIKESQENE